MVVSVCFFPSLHACWQSSDIHVALWMKDDGNDILVQKYQHCTACPLVSNPQRTVGEYNQLYTIQLSDRNTHRESKWVETESGLLLTSLTGAATQIQVLKQNSTSGCRHKHLNPRTQCYLIINASHFNPSVAPFSIKIPWAQIIEHIAARNCFGWNQKR